MADRDPAFGMVVRFALASFGLALAIIYAVCVEIEVVQRCGSLVDSAAWALLPFGVGSFVWFPLPFAAAMFAAKLRERMTRWLAIVLAIAIGVVFISDVIPHHNDPQARHCPSAGF
jgi:hypothetical protein